MAGAGRHDPEEGVAPDGTIRTGARRDRIPESFREVVGAAIGSVSFAAPRASLFVYGSVATGMARVPDSDVDLLSIGLPADAAAEIGTRLSKRFRRRCRRVALAPARPTDFDGESDAAYGGRVFLRHYCAHLAGPDPTGHLDAFPADVRAARGFNGDIAIHAARWRTELNDGTDPVRLARRVARKTLLAVTGLVSIHDDTWTTDRVEAAGRWAALEPSLGSDLARLVTWCYDASDATAAVVDQALAAPVAAIVDAFEASIGLWDTG